MSDAFLKSINLPRGHVPRLLQVRPKSLDKEIAKSEAAWDARFPNGYDCPEAEKEVNSIRSGQQVRLLSARKGGCS